MTANGGRLPDNESSSITNGLLFESNRDTKNDIKRVARINSVKNENTVTIPKRANPTP